MALNGRRGLARTTVWRSGVVLLFILVLGALPTGSLRAQVAALPGSTETQDQAPEPAQPQEQAQDFPGLEQLVPLAANLNDEAARVESVDLVPDFYGSTIHQLAAEERTLRELVRRFETWGDPKQWSINRLLDTRNQLEDLNERLQDLLDELSDPLGTLETLRSTWTQKKTNWAKWEETAREQNLEVPQQTFTEVQQTIAQVLESIREASNRLINLQQEISSEQQVALKWFSRISQNLGESRKQAFRRNAYPLFSQDYYLQFNQELWKEFLVNLNNVRKVPEELYQSYSWVLAFIVICALLLGGLFRKRAAQATEIPEDWQFLFNHPWAGGLFISIFAGSLFTHTPPAIWRWSVAAAGTLTATILICALLERPRLRRVIMTLAGLFILSESCKIIGLPEPIYRLYLLLVCGLAAPICFAAAKRQRQRIHGRMDWLAFAFYFGTLIGIVGLVAEFLGFATLTANLVDAALGTVFVVLFTQMALRLGEGGIQEVLNREWLRNRKLYRQLGPQTENRLVILVRLVVLGYAGLALLVVWKVFDSLSDAWMTLMDLEYSFGEFHVSVEMVFLVICVLYFSVVASWVIQAALDSQILEPRNIDRGVKDSIKRLLHYALVLAGFAIALSMAGIGLEKFTILAGALGVGIGFGLQNIVNNFISGLILLFERPVKVGDSITIDEQWGTISKIGLRSTVVETLDRSEIIVPNSDLISQKVTNWTHTSGVSRITLGVGVEYGSDLGKVLEILDGVGREHREVLKDPEPSAIFTGFGDSSIDFELRVWIADITKRLRIRSELGQAVDRGFREAGITIPFPQRDLHLRSIESNLQTLLGGAPRNSKDDTEGHTE